MDWITGEYELFEVTEPAVQTLPFVYNSPHSGRCYPISFLESARLDSHEIRRSEDHFVDELFAAAPDIGAPLLKANFPRAYLDVNREPYELDPRMFEGTLPPYANIGSMRVAAWPGNGTPYRRREYGHLCPPPAGGRGAVTDRDDLQTLPRLPA